MMNYSESYHRLKSLFSSSQKEKVFDGTEIHEFSFNSLSSKILPGGKDYYCDKHQRLSEERRHRFPNIINSTMSNVAISMRLHSMPPGKTQISLY